MSPITEPTPPSRRDEDFPKTTTIPDGWVSDALTDLYNDPGTMRGDRPNEIAPVRASQAQMMVVPTTGDKPEGGNGRSNGKTHAIAPEVGTPLPASASGPAENESPFARRLDPFPPASDSTGMWL